MPKLSNTISARRRQYPKKMAQRAIFTTNTSFPYFLFYRFREGASLPALRAALKKVILPHPQSACVAFGPNLWKSMARKEDIPLDLAPLESIQAEKANLIATQEDLFVWLHTDDHSLTLDLAKTFHAALGTTLELVDEEQGFQYRKETKEGPTHGLVRDLTGFHDGTANPSEPLEINEAALVGDGSGAHGSHVLVQRWIHDLKSFDKLHTKEKEHVIGRTLEESEELADDVMPPTSHVSRNDTGEFEIFRRSASYWKGVDEHGLMFLSFAAKRKHYDILLRRMYGITDAHHDRLIEFSRAVAGGAYFAPSSEALERALE